MTEQIAANLPASSDGITVAQVADDLGAWLEQCGYAGNDPYQLDNIISSVGDKPLIGPLMGVARRLLKPYHALIPKSLFQASAPIVMPQALGDALSGEGAMPASAQSRRRAAAIFALLQRHRSPLAKNAAWGLPFLWGGTEKHPKHWPTTITTTLVLNGMLDAIHLLDRQAVLADVTSGLRFMIEECGVLHLTEGSCILYGPGDTRLILNASAAAAGLMTRASVLLGRPDLMSLAGQAAWLIAHHQNEDGSWHFAPAHGAHPVDTIIDFRHSGYILEGLEAVRHSTPDAALANRLETAIRLGWSYVQTSLIEGDLPRWAPDQTWPVDSHDVAEAILMATSMRDHALAKRHVRAALSIFYRGEGRFRYKAFADGRSNDAVFIRWTQAPMYKALAKYLAWREGHPGSVAGGA